MGSNPSEEANAVIADWKAPGSYPDINESSILSNSTTPSLPTGKQPPFKRTHTQVRILSRAPKPHRASQVDCVWLKPKRCQLDTGCVDHIAGIVEMASSESHKLCTDSSNLSPATKQPKDSLVSHLFRKQGAAGSTPARLTTWTIILRV